MCGMHGRDVWVALRFDTLVGEGVDEDNNLNADDAFCEATPSSSSQSWIMCVICVFCPLEFIFC